MIAVSFERVVGYKGRKEGLGWDGIWMGKGRGDILKVVYLD